MSGRSQRCFLILTSLLVLPLLLHAQSKKKLLVNGYVIENMEKKDIQGLRFKATGDLLFSRGRLAEAIKYYEKATKFIPNEADVYFKLGEIYYQNKIYKLALSYYDMALTRYTYPENSGKSAKSKYLIWAHQGTILYLMDQPDKSIEKRYELVKNKMLIKKDFPELTDEMIKFFVLSLGETLGRSEWKN